MNQRSFILLGSFLAAIWGCSGNVKNHTPVTPPQVQNTGTNSLAATNNSSTTLNAVSNETATPELKWEVGVEKCFDEKEVYTGDDESTDEATKAYCQNFITQVYGYIEATKRTVYCSERRGLQMNANLTLPYVNRFTYPNGNSGPCASLQSAYGPSSVYLGAALQSRVYGNLYGMSQQAGGIMPFRSAYYQTAQNYLTPAYCSGQMNTTGRCVPANNDQFLSCRHIISGLDDTLAAAANGESRERLVYRLEKLQPEVDYVSERSAPFLGEDVGELINTIRELPADSLRMIGRETTYTLENAAQETLWSANSALRTFIPNFVRAGTSPLDHVNGLFLGIGRTANYVGYAPAGICAQPISGYNVNTIEYQCVCRPYASVQNSCY